MRLEKRIRALEARMLAEPVILHFADGSTREIHGRGDYLLDLFIGSCGGADLSPAQAADLELIRQSVSAQEPGGARMTELIRCFQQHPVEESSSVTPVRG